VIAVPQHLIITLSKVRHSELKGLIDKEPMLHDEEDTDTEFNLLALYVIYEYMKGIANVTLSKGVLLLPVFSSRG
jgi:hypothetical protein